MKLCILSDSHDHIVLLHAAVAAAKAAGAEAVLHCGDLVAPSSLQGIERFGLPIHIIHGNNTGDLFALTKRVASSNNLIHYHGMDADLTLGERRIFMVHYPHYAQGMAATGEWDLVCCGHTHRAEQIELPNLRGGTTLLINPGTVGGVGKAPATFVMADLATLTFEFRELPKPVHTFFP
ncbi:MAG: metallophosphoesterase family protein [Pseudomonadota bacterium]